MEVAPQMRPTSGLAQTGFAVRLWRVKLGITFVTIRLQNAARIGQVAKNVLFFPVRCKTIDSTRR